MAVAVDRREARLVAEARRGDASAFDALAEQHRRGLYQLAVRWLRDPEVALDCVQETLLRAYQSLPRFREQCALSTWLSRILEHVCAEERRRRARESRVPPSQLWEGVPDVEGTLARRQDLGDALRALADLPLTLRTTALLGLVEGRASSEVSGLLGISIEAVKMRLSRARALMAAAPALAEDGSAARTQLSVGYQELATLLLRQGQEEEAGQALRRALQLDPRRGLEVWAWVQLPVTPGLAGAAARQAWWVLAQAAEESDAPEVRLALAHMHSWQFGNRLYAERLLTSLLGWQGRIGKMAHGNLGLLYETLGRPEKALPRLISSLELTTDGDTGYNVTCAAKCLAMLGHPAAWEWVERARVVAMAGWPGPKGARDTGLHTGNWRARVGETYELLGDLGSARKMARAAWKAFPADGVGAQWTLVPLTQRLFGGARGRV